VCPNLAAKPAAGFEAEGEQDLAVVARDLRIPLSCGCGDDFCQSFVTSDHPAWTA
jgi:hypothetical protein